MNEIINELQEYILVPNHRTYYIYLITSLVMALLYLWYQSRIEEEPFTKLVRRYLFNKEQWISKSAFTDYGLIGINILIKIFILIPYFMTGIALSMFVYKKLISSFGVIESTTIPEVYVVLMYTLAILLIGDFTRYVLHLLCHVVPFLWHFHKIHHSATSLNPFTEYRQHPVEMILFYLDGIVVFGLVTGVFYYFFSVQVSMWAILGVNIGRFLFYILGGNLRHSHVPFKYTGWLEKFILSPFQHQIHHSDDPDHYNKNLGSQFAFWDWMFGTLKKSEDVKKELSFGLGERENIEHSNSIKSVWAPVNSLIKKKNIK